MKSLSDSPARDVCNILSFVQLLLDMPYKNNLHACLSENERLGLSNILALCCEALEPLEDVVVEQ